MTTANISTARANKAAETRARKAKAIAVDTIASQAFELGGSTDAIADLLIRAGLVRKAAQGETIAASLKVEQALLEGEFIVGYAAAKFKAMANSTPAQRIAHIRTVRDYAGWKADGTAKPRKGQPRARTEAEHKAIRAAETQLSAIRREHGLEAVSKRGGKRANAGAKRKAAKAGKAGATVVQFTPKLKVSMPKLKNREDIYAAMQHMAALMRDLENRNAGNMPLAWKQPIDDFRKAVAATPPSKIEPAANPADADLPKA